MSVKIIEAIASHMRPIRLVGTVALVPALSLDLPRKIAAAMVVASVIVSCGKQRPPIKRHVNIAIDISDQTDTVLLRYADWTYRMERNLSDTDLLTVTVFAHDNEIVYSDQPIRNRSDFNEKVASRFTFKSAALGKPNTETDKVMSDFDADRFAGTQEDWILTDGGIESVVGTRKDPFGTTLKSLASKPNVARVAVIGVQQEYRRQWKGWLDDLGPKALLRGVGDADSSLALLQSGAN